MCLISCKSCFDVVVRGLRDALGCLVYLVYVGLGWREHVLIVVVRLWGSCRRLELVVLEVFLCP